MLGFITGNWNGKDTQWKNIHIHNDNFKKNLIFSLFYPSPQVGHLNGRSFECKYFMWAMRPAICVKFFPHNSQMNDFSVKWNFLWESIILYNLSAQIFYSRIELLELEPHWYRIIIINANSSYVPLGSGLPFISDMWRSFMCLFNKYRAKNLEIDWMPNKKFENRNFATIIEIVSKSPVV